MSQDDGPALGADGLLGQLATLDWSTDDLGLLADQLLAIAEGQNGGLVPDDIALFLVAPAVATEVVPSVASVASPGGGPVHR